MRERIVAETRGAIKGLNNLKQSYEGDAQFQAAVDVSIETVKLRLEIDTDEVTQRHDRARSTHSSPAPCDDALTHGGVEMHDTGGS